ncbi:hypothetical protein [Carnobacterium funditum]|uniref:hypothetical protein n=1 Tax=Carnobacterium funditum TaxID=2752 RepID=UPI000ABABBDF|nr:hypothetical protein [Carnobacterium funditum]
MYGIAKIAILQLPMVMMPKKLFYAIFSPIHQISDYLLVQIGEDATHSQKNKL